MVDALAEAEFEEARMATEAHEASTATHRAAYVLLRTEQEDSSRVQRELKTSKSSEKNGNLKAPTTAPVEAPLVSAFRSNLPFEALSAETSSTYLEQMEAEILAAESSLSSANTSAKIRKPARAEPVSSSAAIAEVNRAHKLSVSSQESQQSTAADSDAIFSSSAKIVLNLSSESTDLPGDQASSMAPALPPDVTSACKGPTEGSHNDANDFSDTKPGPTTAEVPSEDESLFLASDQTVPPPPPPPRRTSGSTRHQLAKQRLKDRARARSLAPSSAGKPNGLKRRKKRKALPRPLSAPPSARPRPVLEPVLEGSDEEKDESTSSEGDLEGHLTAAPLLASLLLHEEHAQEVTCRAEDDDRVAAEAKGNSLSGSVDGPHHRRATTEAQAAAQGIHSRVDDDAQERASRIAAVQASDLAAREAAFAAEAAQIAATVSSFPPSVSPEVAKHAAEKSSSQATAGTASTVATAAAVPAELRAVAGEEALSVLRDRLLELESANHAQPSPTSSSSSSPPMLPHSSPDSSAPAKEAPPVHTTSPSPLKESQHMPLAATVPPVAAKLAPEVTTAPETTTKAISSVMSPTRTLTRRRRTPSAPPSTKGMVNDRSHPGSATFISQPINDSNDGNKSSSASCASIDTTSSATRVNNGVTGEAKSNTPAAAAVVIINTPAPPAAPNAPWTPATATNDVADSDSAESSSVCDEKRTLLELAHIPDHHSSAASKSSTAAAAGTDSPAINATTNAVVVIDAAAHVTPAAVDSAAASPSVGPVAHPAGHSDATITANAQRREARREARRVAKEVRRAARRLARNQARATKALHKAMLRGMVGMGPPPSTPPQHAHVEAGNNIENTQPREGLDDQLQRRDEAKCVVQVKWRPEKQPASGLWALPPLPPDPPPPELLAAPRPPRPPLAPRAKAKKPRPPAFAPLSFPPPARSNEAHDSNAVTPAASTSASASATSVCSKANAATTGIAREVATSSTTTEVPAATTARKLSRRKRKDHATSDTAATGAKAAAVAKGISELQACAAWVRTWRAEDANAVRASSNSRLAMHFERSCCCWRSGDANEVAEKALSEWFADLGHLADAFEEQEEKGAFVSAEELLEPPPVQGGDGGYLDWGHGDANHYSYNNRISGVDINILSSGGFMVSSNSTVETSNSLKSSNGDPSALAASTLSRSALSQAALAVVRQEALFAFRCHRLDGAIPLLLDESSSLVATNIANQANATPASAATTKASPAPAAAVAAVLRYLRSGETGLEARSTHDKPPPRKLVKAILPLAERLGVPDLVAWCQHSIH